jgi:ethanolamine transporter
VEYFGWIVISIILASAVAGAIAACIDDEKGLGKEFLEGIYSIGYIFLPVAGIMASAPFLTVAVSNVFGWLFALVGADPAMAATTFIAVDMGGYVLAKLLAGNNLENWITATTAGYMAGATIVFSIPVGLAMLQKRDHKYMALGVMAGLLSVPIGVLVANLLCWAISPEVRTKITTDDVELVALQMSLPQILRNLSPLALIMLSLAAGLKFFPNVMIRLFMAFGRGTGILIKLVVVACIVEHFTLATFKIGLFTWMFGSWGFDPIIVKPKEVLAKKPGELTEDHLLRALEVAGYIGIMLAGAFPMVYLIRKYLSKPIESVGRKIGLDSTGAAGILAAAANILAMFKLVKEMRARDKVLCIAFAVCAAFTFGDHLAFTTNFQPNLLLPVIVGKLTGGICGFLIATYLCVPKALELEKQDMIDDAKAILQHVPELKDKPLEITKLKGGMTNVIFKVKHGNDQYVLRVFGQGTDILGIDREREIHCSAAIAEAGLGANVVKDLRLIEPKPYEGFCGALLVSFLPGEPLEPTDLTPDMLVRIGATLKKCHEAEIAENVAEFSVFRATEDYLAKARARNVDVPANFNDDLVRHFEAKFTFAEPLCLCHNDLLAGNFMDHEGKLRIIDWEYGGRGQRFFDLGNFAANMQLNEEYEKKMLSEYFDGNVPPDALERLKLMRVVSDLREAAWGFLQQAISKLGAPKGFDSYHAYGTHHLDRALVAAKKLNL